MSRVLITGANGFVGSQLCDVLARAGYRVRGAYRTIDQRPVAEKVVVGEIGSRTEWAAALEGVDAVIHTAARVHVLGDDPANADLYTETNARGTLRLAEAAERAGVGRFIFLSSIKVNGEETRDRPYTRDDQPQPRDPYGESKWLAERQLRELARAGSMEIATVRPPLVYGPGVRANFLRLMSWVDKGIPLPLGGIENRRSLVSVWNLCDLLLHLLKTPSTSAHTWLVSDGEDVSTPELIRRIGRAMGRRTRLLPIPVGALRAVGGLLGRGAEVNRLCGSLVLDTRQTRAELGWEAPTSLDEALARTVKWYLAERQALAN